MAPIHLPTYHTSLIGRARDVAALTTALHDPATRLLTLVGDSGSGKTRLALEVATAVAATFADGVVFVSLAPVQDVRFVLPTLAQALEVTEQGTTSLLTTLCQHLASRHMLLVLDNIEQVVDCAADLVTLLAAAPHLTLVLTSQVALHVTLEMIYSLPPLAVPDDTASTTTVEVLEYPAIALFVERLQAVQPRFRLTPTNIPAVVRICQLLDGYPLAIELVAAHSAALAPRDLLLLLRNHLGIHPHQASVSISSRADILHPVLEWCIGRLPDLGQRLMERLGVFFGGWTTEAAQAVLTPEDDLETVAEALALLVQKHLVQIETLPGQQPRYVVMDAIHDYSSSRLRRRRRDGTLQARHATYYAALAHEAGTLFQGPSMPIWVQRLREEVHNLRTALTWGLAQLDPTLTLRIGADLFLFWDMQGWYSEACEWLQPALARAMNAPVSDRARAWNVVGSFSIDLGKFVEAQAALEESYRLFQSIGDIQESARPLNNLGILLMQQGRLSEVTQIYQQCLTIFRQATPPNDYRISTILNNLGNVLYRQGQLAATMAAYSECIEIRTRLDDINLPTSLANLAETLIAQGDYPAAHTVINEGLAIVERTGDTFNKSLLQCCAAILALETGDDTAAIAQFTSLLTLHQQTTGNPNRQIEMLLWLGYVALLQENWSDAAAWLLQTQNLAATMGETHHRAMIALLDSRLALAHGDATRSWTLLYGSLRAVLQSSYHIWIPEVAEHAALLLLRHGAPDHATQLWQAADTWRRTRGMPYPPSLIRWYADHTTSLLSGSAVLPSVDADDLLTLLTTLIPLGAATGDA